jgi:2-oxoglutarate dehydrogenase E1 component
LQPEYHPELRVEGPEADRLRKIYCGAIGVEFMHIPDPDRRDWVRNQIEREPDAVDQNLVLAQLIQTDLLEETLQTRYLGNKRFSIKGVDALVPLLLEILEKAAGYEVRRAILAMSHRGRINVVANVVGRPLAEVFAGFEDVDPKSTLGGGDVKYHLGATGSYEASDGYKVPIHLVSNPSHLEAVVPVALGRAKARQTRMGEEGPNRVLPVIMHGDAAFAGQGILAEVLNLAYLTGFDVGGTVHVVVNNLIGFTAVPEELHSSRFASDVAKRLPIPVFHVNAEDLDAVIRIARIATDYRYVFQSDVVIDLIGFRQYGHSEVDDPTITQPLLYKKIQGRQKLWESFAEKIGVDRSQIDQQINHYRSQYDEAIEQAKKMVARPLMRELPSYWDGFKGGRYNPGFEVVTGLSRQELERLSGLLTSYPPDFVIHPKVAKLLQQRSEMGKGERKVDFGMAEALAFASVLEEGCPIRLTGQDSKRGTFSHRHSALVDFESGEEYVPLQHLSPRQGRFECYDSMLSEAAALGFEYGYSRDYPDALVLWEAQFGDFANGAQIIIDQFITAAEDKWDLLSGLVMLLPHGYEGQGPEHSSARIERYLQLAARENTQVVQPSTAAQYFHLIRRQALWKWRKPLIVFTPKSMLRSPSAVSDLEEFTSPQFSRVIGDPDVVDAERVFVCSGKVGHDLRKARSLRGEKRVAIVFLEQLYPFPENELREELNRHPNASEIVWVQEEPTNMGALTFVFPRLQRLARGRSIRSVKRSATGTPATGSAKAHQVEQQTLMALAFARIQT